jgi:DNA-binding beta-propeller fold protein YncE
MLKGALRGWGAAVLTFVIAGVLLSGGPAGARAPSRFGPRGRRADSSESTGLTGPLTAGLAVPSMEALDEGAVERQSLETRRLDPKAVAMRQRSQTEFRRLGRHAALLATRRAFPELALRSDDESPRLHSGQRVVRYKSSFLAETQLGPGKRGFVASLTPMAKESAQGSLSPVDLTLEQADGTFEPRETTAPVQIPSNLDKGITAKVGQVSLVPVDASGNPVSAAGESDGASVIYPNTATDTDILAKPTSTGFELAAVLRAPDSPQIQRYRVQGPAGLQLEQPSPGAPAEVLVDGVHIGTIAPPTATDASGARVSASMSVEGSTLAVSVSPEPKATQWPVSVDPTWYYVNDSTLPVYGGAQTNWTEFHNGGVGISYGPTPGAYVWASRSNPGEVGGLAYQPQGDTRIYYAEDESSAELSPAGSRGVEAMYNVGTKELYRVPIAEGVNYTNFTDYLCAKPFGPPESCVPEKGSNNDQFQIFGEAGINGLSYGWWFSIQRVKLYMAEEHGTEAFFNTTSPTVSKEAGERMNVLAGPNRWLGRNSGAFEVVAKNPGMGVALLSIEEEGGGSFKHTDNNHALGLCRGELCPLEDAKAFSYNEALAEGEDKVHFYAEGSDGNAILETKIVKVDAKAPTALEVTGWPENNEIGSVPASLTVRASDGTSPTASSGVKTVSVSIDGQHATVLPEASCSPGPCTAQGTYTLSAGNLTEGAHHLVVTAIDAAGNEATPQSSLFDVRRPAALPAGPGSVEPTSGQFDLSATDASLSSGTEVSRTYRSREIPAAGSGPLGPQWSLNLGSSESLTALPDGSVALSAADRGRTTFQPKGALEFVSPQGDTNLKLVAKEEVAGKGITEYVMSDSRAGTSITFTQPAGTQETAPEFAGQFGSEGVSMKPGGLAVDKAGDVWVTDATNSRLLEFNAAGELRAQAGRYGTEAGAMRGPSSIALNQSSGNIYVADPGNQRIDEFNSEGHSIGTISGVNLGTVGGLTIDASGNLWVADKGYHRLDEFKASGEFVTAVGTTGQFGELAGIAYASGDLFVAEPANKRVQVVTTSGTFVREIGGTGSGAGSLSKPTGIVAEASTGRIYVTDASAGVVKEYSATGTYITKLGKSGMEPGEFSEPNGIAIGARNAIYVTDAGSDLAEIWSRNLWLPHTDEGPVRTVAGSDDYVPVELEAGRTELLPKELLGPIPTGVTCGTKPEELKKGCRALLLEYTTSTGTASGEGQGEWGTYKGRLNQVALDAYNPATKKNEPIPVAEYSYDGHGRLRAEWDPRVTPNLLMTKYGYDEEGHVTALTPPGQQTWEFSYGTTSADPSAGRLLKITRGPASSELWSGAAPANSEGPAITGTAAVGSTLKVSTGKWSNEPGEALAFAYQWKRCNEAGAECAAIPGAVNQTYTAIVSDAKHTLAATVQATNGAGMKTASAAHTVVVSGAAFAYNQTIGSLGSTNGKFSEPTAVAVAPSGNVWVADPGNHRLQELTPGGGFIAAVGWGVTDGKEEFERCTASCRSGFSGGGAGEFSDPEGIGINQENGRLYVGDDAQNRVDILTSNGVPLNTFAAIGNSGHLLQPHGVAVASNGTVWVADTGENHLVEYGSEGEYMATVGQTGKGAGEFEGVTGVAVVGSHVFVTDLENAKVKEFSTEGTHELIRTFGESGSGKGQFTYPWATTYDPLSEQLLVSSYGDGRIESYSLTGTAEEEFGHQGSGSSNFNGPSGIAVNPSTGAAYIADELNNRVDEWAPGGLATEPIQSPPSSARGSVTTLEYNVPTSGTGIEHPLTAAETKTWGQEADLPMEGTAIFPPDKPASWPTASYVGAAIIYLDSRSRPVNTVTRTGGVSTTEYNNENLTTRTLTPIDRERALTHGGSSAAVAQTLDTRNKFNANGQLTETLGPEHEAEIVHGHAGKEEARVRERTKYTYDETYGLVTKEEDGALNSAKEEFDKRTTTKSYTGQGGLGWELRKPTSVTADSGGLNLTTTTEYDPESGQVVSVRPPGKSTNNAPQYTWAFGSHFTSSASVTTDSSGNVWVADTANNRIDEYSGVGLFEKGVGWGVATGAPAIETCTTECKKGIAGSGSGQFDEPAGIAYDAFGSGIYVSDTGNNRIELLSLKGAFKRAFGTAGSGAGQLSRPLGLTVKVGGGVWVADSGNHRLEQFSEKGEYGEVTAAGKGEFTDVELCGSGESQLFATDPVAHRVDEIESGAIVRTFGGAGSEGGDIGQVGGVACDPVSKQLYVSDSEESRVDIYTLTGTFVNAFGSEGSGTGFLQNPSALAVSSTGAAYVVDGGNGRISEWTPSAEGAREQITNYYSAGAESPVKACRSHPEWADLPCQTEPAEQLSAVNTPLSPVTTVIYNIYDEPERVTETYASQTRTKATEYDAAGRVKSSSTTGSWGVALPPVTDVYNANTGALETVKTTVEGKSEAETTTRNSVGATTSYTDATGVETTFEYEAGGDERLVKYNDGKGFQTYQYDSTTGLRTALQDSSAIGEVTATYDSEGQLATETLPNELIEKLERDETGAVTSIRYEKTISCAKACPETWYSDSRTSAVRGEAISESTTLAQYAYSYDSAGRLLEAIEQPTAGGCRAHVYAYDESNNRTEETKRETTASSCPMEGGSSTTHLYDSAGQLVDSGVAYDPYGDVVSLPGADAEGHTLTSTFYVDGALATSSQNGRSLSYLYDPSGREKELHVVGGESSTVVQHYSSEGTIASWADEGTKWTRYVPGISGELLALQPSVGAPTVELHDLHGDMVASTGISEAEHQLQSTFPTTEFGQPVGEHAPPQFSWLAEAGVASQYGNGLSISTLQGAAYVPQIARNLQGAPIEPPGSCPTGCGHDQPREPTVSMEGIESAEAIARQIAAEEEAARQEALAEEGEGEAYDPEGLASYNTTKERANQLWHDAANAALLSYAVSFIPDIGDYVSGGVEGLKQLLRESAHSLAGCADAKGIEGRAYQYGVCFIHETRVGKGKFSIPIFATAELCTFERTRNGVNEYNCLESGRKRVKGPWYPSG